MQERKLCQCNQRPVAINRRIGNRIYYRKLCDVCARQGTKVRIPAPAWFVGGYRKKTQCEKCGFKFKLGEQSGVFYTDGNLKNNNHANLKTICLNCQQEVYKSHLPWKSSPIVPDF